MAEHRARITWSPEQVRQGLPPITQTVDPAWFADDRTPRAEGWSLMCMFEPPPNEQGSPTVARVRFVMPDAPHERLRPGATLRLFERGTHGFANVHILD